MENNLSKLSDVVFLLLIASTVLYLGSDAFGIFKLSRETGHIALKVAFILAPISAVIFTIISLKVNARRHVWYLVFSAAISVIYAVIVFMVMNSGI